MALVIFLLPSVHCLTFSFQAFSSYLHWHFRNSAYSRLKSVTTVLFLWNSFPASFNQAGLHLGFFSPSFNYAIGHIASNVLCIFLFTISAVCSLQLHFTQELVMWLAQCSSVLGQGLVLGLSGLLLFLCIATWVKQYVSGCWVLVYILTTLIMGYLDTATVPWGPWVPSALVYSRPHCLLTSLSLVHLIL